MSTYRDRLAALDDAYRNAPVPGSNQLPPDGEYQCRIGRFDFLESKKNGRLYLKTEASVAVGPLLGYPVEFLHDLEDPDRLKQVKGHVAALELDPGQLSDLEDVLPQALDAIVLVEVWTSDRLDANGNPYRNARVRSRMSGGIASSDVPVPAAVPQATQYATDDQIPF